MQHFLLDCPLYEEHHLDLPLLLGYEKNEEHSNWGETILKELGDYIRNTGRLTSKVAENGTSK